VLQGDTLGGTIAEVIALIQQRLVFAFDAGLAATSSATPLRERPDDGIRLVAGQPTRPLS